MQASCQARCQACSAKPRSQPVLPQTQTQLEEVCASLQLFAAPASSTFLLLHVTRSTMTQPRAFSGLCPSKLSRLALSRSFLSVRSHGGPLLSRPLAVVPVAPP